MKNAIDFREDSDNNGWVMTYADLVTLLLVFFILLFSVSTVKEESFEETIDAVKSALKGTGQGSKEGAGSGTKDEIDSTKTEVGTVPTESLDPPKETGEKEQAPTEIEQPIIVTPFSIPLPTPSEKDKEEEAKKKEIANVSNSVRQLAQQTNTEELSKITSENDKITISISGDLFFNNGSAQFKRDAMPVMDGIGNILRNNENFTLAIAGHTDNVPISTNRFPSNWELSAIRATTVLRYFARGGMPLERLTATGYGQSAPLLPNDSPENRSENRRIEFILERDPL